MPKNVTFPATLSNSDLLAAQGFDPRAPLSQETLRRIARAVRRFGFDRTPQPVDINGAAYPVTDVTVRSR